MICYYELLFNNQDFLKEKKVFDTYVLTHMYETN